MLPECQQVCMRIYQRKINEHIAHCGRSVSLSCCKSIGFTAQDVIFILVLQMHRGYVRFVGRATEPAIFSLITEHKGWTCRHLNAASTASITTRSLLTRINFTIIPFKVSLIPRQSLISVGNVPDKHIGRETTCRSKFWLAGILTCWCTSRRYPFYIWDKLDLVERMENGTIWTLSTQDKASVSLRSHNKCLLHRDY